MENRYKIIIDMKNRVISNTKFKQGDTDSSVLEINLVDNSLAVDITGQTIVFNFAKSDGTIVTQDITTGVSILNALTGNFQCILKNNTLAAPGIVNCEITFSDFGEILSTATFNFNVEKSIGNGPLSTNYISAVDNQIVGWQTEFNVIKAAYAADIDLSSANANLELIASRMGEVDLPTKMGKVTSQLAEKANKQTVDIRDFGGVDDGVTDTLLPFQNAKIVCGVGGTVIFPRTNGVATSTYYFSTFPLATTNGIKFDVAENVTFSLPGSPGEDQVLNLARDVNVFERIFHTNRVWLKDKAKKYYLNESDIDKSVITSIQGSEMVGKSSAHSSAYSVTTPTLTVVSATEVMVPNAGATVISSAGIALAIGETFTASFSSPDAIPFMGGILVLTALSHAYLFMHDLSGVATIYISYKKSSGAFVEYDSWSFGAYASYFGENSLWSVERVNDTSFRVLLNGINVSDGIIDLGESIIFAGMGAYNSTFHIKNMIKETNKVKGGMQPLNFSIYGDSVTSRRHGSWDGIFKDALNLTMGMRIGTVTNNAVSGYTSTMALTEMQSVGVVNANYLLLLIGTNDIQTQTAVSTYISNITSMVAIAKAAGARVILGVPPLYYPITVTGYGQASSNYEKGAEYRSALLRYAGDNNIKIVDLPNILGMCTIQSDIVCDDIHPSFSSYEIIGLAYAKAVLGDYLTNKNYI